MRSFDVLRSFLVTTILVSCQREQHLFTRLASSETNIDFSNTIVENDTVNMVDYLYVYNGGGVAIGDINNDNLPDIYLTSNQGGDKLYLNKGEFKFEDISGKCGIVKKGWSTGVTMADVNADGLLDIYVCKSGNNKGSLRANHLYVNKGNLLFEEEAQGFGIADTSYTNQSAFFDFDKDGDLDLYLLTSTNKIRNPNQVRPVIHDGSGLSPDKLYENNGNNTFTDVSKKAGILHDGFGLGLAICDLNDDGWEDILATNDFLTNDLLYINNQDGTFTESAKEYFKHHSQFAMGNDVGDFNNDGLLDVVVADMLPADNEQRKKMAGPHNYYLYEMALRNGYHPQFMRNTLQLNMGKNTQGRPVFSEMGQLAGIHSTDWSWSPLLIDVDNDGWKDLFITNGYLRDITDLDFVSYNQEFSQRVTADEINTYLKRESVRMPTLRKSNFFFRNRKDLTFENVTTNWTDNWSSLSNGAASADLDNDGDLDLVINNINDPASVLKNNTRNNYLKVILKGSGNNLFALGSTVTLFNKGTLQKQNLQVTRGYQSSSDYPLVFGLGRDGGIDSLEVIWPDGKRQVKKSISANQSVTFYQKEAKDYQRPAQQHTATIFTDITLQAGVNYLHEEEFYPDYNQEGLLPHKLSQQGPRVAVTDVDHNGLEDFFVGGSYKHHGQLYLQNSSGQFTRKMIFDEASEKSEEDIGVLFFDADNDLDQDLYIVSGSNEYFDGSPYYQDRLYLNDGRGNFDLAVNRLPLIRHSGSCIAAGDFDKDGDLDLFRGGRLRPLQFPLPGDSYLLRNDKGTFTDVTELNAGGLRHAGMVTDAIWSDYDHDSWADLIVVGEYMPVLIYKNINGKLEPFKTDALANSNGLWNAIQQADLDNDGDQDYVLGNVGLNTLHFSKEEPLSVYAFDFDGNGRMDAIASHFLNGVEYPTPSRDDLLRQLPSLKSKFLKYADYARAKMTDVLSTEQLEMTYKAKAYMQQTCILENSGGGNFKFKPLPLQAQVAPVQSIVGDDVDQDGTMDILLAGNDYSNEVVAGRYDAFVGLFLKNDAKKGFVEVPHWQSGFFVDGDARSLTKIRLAKNRKGFIVTQNGGPLKIFEVHPDLKEKKQ